MNKIIRHACLYIHLAITFTATEKAGIFTAMWSTYRNNTSNVQSENVKATMGKSNTCMTTVGANRVRP